MSTENYPISGYDSASTEVETAHPLGGQVTQGKRFWVRAGAYMIDWIVLFVTNSGIGLIIGVFVGMVLAIAGRDVTPNQQTLWGWNIILGLVLSTLYFALFEGLYGASVGKLILGMRVVRVDGRPCGLSAALIRAILRIWDGMLLGLIAYRSMKPPLQQRWGDKAAKTIVVGDKDPLIQEHRPWWLLLVAALLYLIVSTAGTIVTLILALL
jgi:uncharacterized RDD family membrane protein YckC